MNVLTYIQQEFPEVAELIPEGCHLFNYGFGVGEGVATEVEALAPHCLRYSGSDFFLCDPNIPDGFVAAGIRNAGGSEYLFFLAMKDGRRFWFQYQYVNFQVGNFNDAAREAFRHGVAAWRAEKAHVVCIGSKLLRVELPPPISLM